MSWRRIARGIGGFLLFFVLFILIGSIAGLLVGTMLGARDYEGSTLGKFLDVCAAVATGFLGVQLGSSALRSLMKDYPGRAIGVAFVLWLVLNYAAHFIFFPERTDFETYRGLVQSLVACVTAWFAFRLPPLTPSQSN
jgi:hypothetical protein